MPGVIYYHEAKASDHVMRICVLCPKWVEIGHNPAHREFFIIQCRSEQCSKHKLLRQAFKQREFR